MEAAYFNILLQSDYDSIINACKADPLYFKICRMPYFWKQKAFLDFDIPNKAFESISEKNNKLRYEYLMYVDPNDGLMDALHDGNLAIIPYFISKGADNYNDILITAAGIGHMNIVKLMLSKGAKSYNHALINASYKGQIEMVELMLSLGADCYDQAIDSAEINDHTAIADLIKSYIY